jgi:two-component sensor histidine kinase
MHGFGSRMISRSLSGQLGGELSYDWRPSGVVITLRMHRQKLAS